jgi:hypothetical protein
MDLCDRAKAAPLIITAGATDVELVDTLASGDRPDDRGGTSRPEAIQTLPEAYRETLVSTVEA